MTDLPRGSKVEREILSLLLEHGQMYGLEMVKASTMLKRGTIYVSLVRMEDKGWIKSTAEPSGEPGMPRLRYSISGLGRQAAQAK